MATFRVDVDGKKVASRIRDRIEDGVDSAADEINDEMRQVAKGKIRDENAVFTRELLHGFTDSKVTFGKSTVASLRNLSDHAPYQERGVSGIYKKRKTPYSYKNKKPPLDALIPWVIQNLHGSFWPDDLGDPPDGYGGGDVSSPSRSSRTTDSGGVNVTETQNSVPLDENRLYAGEDGFSVRGINDDFHGSDLFPNQKIVVFNKNEKEYERATIRSFGDSDLSLKFELDDYDGTLFKISNSGAGPWRLVGTENWESLDRSEQQRRLRNDFDNRIADGYKNWLTSTLKSKYNLTEPKTTVVKNAADFWVGDEMFERYKDSSIIAEQVRNFIAVVSYKNSYLKSRPSLGGSIYNPLDTPRFSGVFLSDNQLNNISNYNPDEIKMILAHEAKHALTSILGLQDIGDSYEWQDIVEKARWSPGGLQTVADPDLPTHADKLLFRDNDNSGNVLGGTGWLKDAYYKVDMDGPFGITEYQPNLQTSKDEPYKRLHEAANHAWWLQTVAARKEFNDNYTGSLKDEISKVGRSSFFVRSGYSSKNAAETLATLEEVMWASRGDWESLLEDLNQYYPWLIEAWLEGHNPPEEVVKKLESLGFNV